MSGTSISSANTKTCGRHASLIQQHSTYIISVKVLRKICLEERRKWIEFPHTSVKPIFFELSVVAGPNVILNQEHQIN